jgi:CheY-like chemotaxis protein
VKRLRSYFRMTTVLCGAAEFVLVFRALALLSGAITANRDEAVRPRVLAQGAVACLFKPFSDTALLEALNAALQVS